MANLLKMPALVISVPTSLYMITRCQDEKRPAWGEYEEWR